MVESLAKRASPSSIASLPLPQRRGGGRDREFLLVREANDLLVRSGKVCGKKQSGRPPREEKAGLVR